jgi:hypothetical protein
LQRQYQEKMGPENCEDQKRQEARLAGSVEEQAGENQQLDLEISQHRQVVNAENDRRKRNKLQ